VDSHTKFCISDEARVLNGECILVLTEYLQVSVYILCIFMIHMYKIMNIYLCS
jgi:hypothetical protein